MKLTRYGRQSDEVFDEAVDLNLEFKAADVKLYPDDHIDASVITKVKETWN